MKVEPYKIEIYQTQEGKEPFLDWLNGLKDLRSRAKILVRLDRLQKGNLGDYKALGNCLYELRIKHGPGYRVFYTQQDDRIIVLLCGSDKAKQSESISKARQYIEELNDNA